MGLGLGLGLVERAATEGAREHLAPAVGAGRVLRREEHEVRVRPHHLRGLRHEELAVVVEQPVERLEHICGREVELVEHDPVAEADGLCEGAVVELQRA